METCEVLEEKFHNKWVRYIGSYYKFLHEGERDHLFLVTAIVADGDDNYKFALQRDDWSRSNPAWYTFDLDLAGLNMITNDLEIHSGI